jgi:hypothetical protein
MDDALQTRRSFQITSPEAHYRNHFLLAGSGEGRITRIILPMLAHFPFDSGTVTFNAQCGFLER